MRSARCERPHNARACTQALPFVQPLVTIIKFMLTQRDLNDASRGGLSSFGIVMMVRCRRLHLHCRPDVPASACRLPWRAGCVMMLFMRP